MHPVTSLFGALLVLISGFTSSFSKSPVIQVNGLPAAAPLPELTSEAALIETGLCGAAPRAGKHLYGCFHYDFDWARNRTSNVLAVNFHLGITINDHLKPALKEKVLAHERQHFQDFRSLALELAQSLRASSMARRDPDLDNRMAWFKFDVCRAGEFYHLKLNQSLWGTAACAGMEPRAARPLF